METEPKAKDKAAIQHLYNTLLPTLAGHIHQSLEGIIPLFHDFRLEIVVDTWTKGADAAAGEVISIEKGNVQYMGLRLQLEGFQRPGMPPFDLAKDLLFTLGLYSYTAGPDKNQAWLEKPYLTPWSKTETEELTQRWCDDLIDNITKQLETFSG